MVCDGESIPRLEIDSKSGSWSYLLGDTGVVMASSSLEAKGRLLTTGRADGRTEMPPDFRCDGHGVKRCLSVKYTFQKPAVAWTVRFNEYLDNSFIIIESSIKNNSSSDLRLGKCSLLDLDASQGGSLRLGENIADATFFSETGTQAWSMVKQVSSDNGKHVSQTIGHIYNQAVPVCLNCSFATFDRAKTEVTIQHDKEKGIKLLNAYCNFDDFVLPAGESIESERLFVDLRKDPYASLETWADVTNKIYKPSIWERLPTGWLGWAWVDHFKEKPYEDIVIENVDAIKEKIGGFGLQYIWVSLGNMWRCTPGYWLKENRTRFPHGLKWLADELKKRGMKLGLWCGAFWVTGYVDNPSKDPWLAELYEEMKDAFLKKDGKYVFDDIKWPYGYWADFPKEERPGFFCLDPTHPKTQEWLRKVFSEYRKIGVRYYMIDWIDVASGSTPGRHLYNEYHNTGLVKGPEALRAGLRVIRDTAGPDTYLLASTGPTIQGVGLMDGVRIGPDYGEGRPIVPDLNRHRTYNLGNWGYHKRTGCNMAVNYFTHRKLYINDSCNLLTVDGDIPLNEAQISTTLFGLCGGPMILGDNIPTIQPERLALIKKCLPRYPDIAKPVDLFTAVYPEDYPKTFNLRVDRSWGAWNVVAVFNYDEPELKVNVTMKDLGLDSEKEYLAYDFWDEKFLGIVKNEISLTVPAYSVKLLSLQEKREHPWIVSSDMHITQGAVELIDLRWNETAKTLSGACERPKNEKGTLVLYLPKGYEIMQVKNAKAVKTERQIYHVQLDFKDRLVKWEVTMSDD
jgi:hypothetical protein